jgi:hypothetical protein
LLATYYNFFSEAIIQQDQILIWRMVQSPRLVR